MDIPVVDDSMNHERQRLERIDALAAVGRDGVDELVGLLTERSVTVRRAVVSALASIGAAGVSALIGLMSHDDDDVAVAAVEALGRIGGRAAVDSLVEMVKSGNFSRVLPAIDVLGRSGDPRAVAPLAELLDGGSVALEAARALGRTGDRRAVPPLVSRLVSSSDATVRVGAVAIAELLTLHGERTGDTAPPEAALRASAGAPEIRRLVHCLDGADPGEQIAICRILGIVAGEAAIAALARMLSAPAPVAPVAAESLRRAAAEQILQHRRAGDAVGFDPVRHVLAHRPHLRQFCLVTDLPEGE